MTDIAPTTTTPVHPWVEPTRVHRNVYLDESLFDEELRQIFHRTWIYVAHESEVANAGDYKTALIGRQPVIVSRDEDGEIHVLMNRCTHRAATVCQAAAGNSSFFRCEYHGWTFKNDGELAAPTFRSGYDPADFDQTQFALKRAPRVDSYRGLVFASLSPTGETLDEHLGRRRSTSTSRSTWPRTARSAWAPVLTATATRATGSSRARTGSTGTTPTSSTAPSSSPATSAKVSSVRTPRAGPAPSARATGCWTCAR